MESECSMKKNGVIVKIYWQGWGWWAWVKNLGTIAYGYSLDEVIDETMYKIL